MRRYVFALVAATIVAIIAPMIWLQIGGEPAPAPNREAPIDTAEDVEAEAALGGAIAALDSLTQAIRKGDLRQVPSLVRRLVAERAVAAAAGAEVSRLNGLIAAKLASQTNRLKPRAQSVLHYNLGAIVPRSA